MDPQGGEEPGSTRVQSLSILTAPMNRATEPFLTGGEGEGEGEGHNTHKNIFAWVKPKPCQTWGESQLVHRPATGLTLFSILYLPRFLHKLERASRLRPMLASSLPFGIFTLFLPLVFVWLATVKSLNKFETKTLPFFAISFSACLSPLQWDLVQNGVVQG